MVQSRKWVKVHKYDCQNQSQKTKPPKKIHKVKIILGIWFSQTKRYPQWFRPNKENVFPTFLDAWRHNWDIFNRK